MVAGFISACWSPLIPFAKARLRVNDAQLGLLLLTFGVGSLIGVSLAGLFAARIGSRPIVLAGGLGMCLVLPVLSVAAAPLTLGAALFVFGASLGALDVAMNAHAVEVEAAAGVPLMSGFHALFSLGGFAGAAWMTLFLRSNVSALAATIAAALAGACLIASAATGLPGARPHDPRVAMFVLPSGLVVVIAALAATMFLAEGAVYDWSALLIVDRGVASRADAGVGFILFSIAMTMGRLSGDAAVRRLGRPPGAAVGWRARHPRPGAGAGVPVRASTWQSAGFLLWSRAGARPTCWCRSSSALPEERQTSMPPTLAVAAVTSTTGLCRRPPPDLPFSASSPMRSACRRPSGFWRGCCLSCRFWPGPRRPAMKGSSEPGPDFCRSPQRRDSSRVWSTRASKGRRVAGMELGFPTRLPGDLVELRLGGAKLGDHGGGDAGQLGSRRL